MNIKMIRTFIPSKDFEISKDFYQDLGFKIIWENKELCELGSNRESFFLQKLYAKEWAENTMLQMFVEDLDSLFEIANSLLDKYDKARIKEITNSGYGRTFHLLDPSGVLWHMTEAKK